MSAGDKLQVEGQFFLTFLLDQTTTCTSPACQQDQHPVSHRIVTLKNGLLWVQKFMVSLHTVAVSPRSRRILDHQMSVIHIHTKS